MLPTISLKVHGACAYQAVRATEARNKELEASVSTNASKRYRQACNNCCRVGGACDWSVQVCVFVILVILGLLVSLIVWGVQLANDQSENSLCSLSGYTTDAVRNIVGVPQGYATCAVVGSAGFLRKQRLGAEIDSHDFVIRANLAPVSGYEEIVGSKTSLRIMNTQALGVVLEERLCTNRSSEFKCPDYPVFLNSGSYEHIAEIKRKCPTTPFLGHEQIDAFDRVMLHLWPNMLGNIMSGGWAIGVAMRLCNNITRVYGVTHDSTIALGHNSSYHYYDNNPPSPVDDIPASSARLSKAATRQSCLSLHEPASSALLTSMFPVPTSVVVRDAFADGLDIKYPLEHYGDRGVSGRCSASA